MNNLGTTEESMVDGFGLMTTHRTFIIISYVTMDKNALGRDDVVTNFSQEVFHLRDRFHPPNDIPTTMIDVVVPLFTCPRAKLDCVNTSLGVLPHQPIIRKSCTQRNTHDPYGIIGTKNLIDEIPLPTIRANIY